MNPLKSLIRYGTTSLLLCTLENVGLLSQPAGEPTALSSAAESKNSLLRQLELRDQRLAKATERAVEGLKGKGLDFFNEDCENWANWRESFFSDATGRRRAAAQLTDEELSTWAEEVRRRTSWIHGVMDHRHHKNLSGFWSDGGGGHFSLVEQGDQLHFLASCVRGETRHLGSIQGVAKRSGAKAVFSISEYDGEPTHLEFSFEKPWIVLKGTNTGPYHGNRAYFDGHYAKIAPLSAEERQVVLQATQQP